MIYVELFNNSSNPLMYNSAKTVPKYPFQTIKLNNIYHIIDLGLLKGGLQRAFLRIGGQFFLHRNRMLV